MLPAGRVRVVQRCAGNQRQPKKSTVYITFARRTDFTTAINVPVYFYDDKPIPERDFRAFYPA